MGKQALVLACLMVSACAANTTEAPEVVEDVPTPAVSMLTAAGEPAALLALRGWLTLEAGAEPALECRSAERGSFSCTSDADSAVIQLWYEDNGAQMAMIMRAGKVQAYARWCADAEGSTAAIDYTADTMFVIARLTTANGAAEIRSAK
jgi:hypothetical protein